MDWLEQLGITVAESRRILEVSYKAVDADRCQRALIFRIVKGIALVRRWDWDGSRMLDYPVVVRH